MRLLANASFSGNVSAVRFAIALQTRSCTPRTVIAPAAARPRDRPSRRFEQGSGNLLVHGSDELNDTRCGTCGSLLFSVVRDGAYVHVAMGSLIDEPSVRPTEHIFVGSKAPWFEITDDLPQAEEYE
jgi:hypothetical protein